MLIELLMRYDLEIIKKELGTLPEYDTQLYLQGDTPDMWQMNLSKIIC